MNIRAWYPLVVIGVIVALALAGLFGGAAVPVRVAEAEGVRLETQVPARLRSGLLFESRFILTARRPLTDATIGLTPPLWRGITINTTIPEPESEGFEDDEFRLHFGPMKAGERIEVRLESQVNPARWGRTRGAVSVNDGTRPLLTLSHDLMVFP